MTQAALPLRLDGSLTLLETVELDHAADSRRPYVSATPRP